MSLKRYQSLLKHARGERSQPSLRPLSTSLGDGTLFQPLRAPSLTKMKSIIQDLTGIVLSIGVLLLAIKSVMKKGADLYRYATKISKEIKTAPQRQQNVSAAPKKRRLLRKIFGSDWFLYGIVLAVQICALAWEVSDPKPVDRGAVLRIAMDCAAMAVVISLMLVSYVFSRALKWIENIFTLIGWQAEGLGTLTKTVETLIIERPK